MAKAKGAKQKRSEVRSEADAPAFEERPTDAELAARAKAEEAAQAAEEKAREARARAERITDPGRTLGE